MLRFYAHYFVHLMKSLEKAEANLANGQSGIDVIMAKQGLDLQGFRRQLAENKGEFSVYETAWKKTYELLDILLGEIETTWGELGLSFAVAKATRIRQQLPELKMAYAELKSHLRDLTERIEDQLRERVFFFVPSDRAKYYLEDKVFDPAVVDRFPIMREEMDEARLCIAFDRYTAAVFHLMRIMELGVKRLAKRLRVPKDQVEDKAWGPILQAINAKIVRLHNNNPRKVMFSEASAHLNQVRAAWRNTAMHPKRTYTQEQAEEILASVKTFLNHLVGNLL
jgi:hypothetical protein